MRYIVQAGPDNDWDILDTEKDIVAPFSSKKDADDIASEMNAGTRNHWIAWMAKDY